MSVTAVPLRPIKSGALVLLVIGIVLAITAGVALAFQGKPQELRVEVIEAGSGPKPTDADIALINYRGTLEDGTEFDQGQQVPMPVAGVVPGFAQGLKMMSKGAKYKFFIPPALAYGAEEKKDQNGKVVIPANSTLVFEVELLDFLPEAVVRQMQQQQQLQGMMPPGAMPPGAVPPPQNGAPGGN